MALKGPQVYSVLLKGLGACGLRGSFSRGFSGFRAEECVMFN